jgi:RHS repeat-associated protein
MLDMEQSYDANGSTLAAGGKTFAYDSENRLTSMNGGAVRIVYDAEGTRVAKGSITSWSCNNGINPSTNLPYNGFTPTNSYVLGPSGEQLTETDGNGNWIHSNVYAAGMLIATYDTAPTGDPALHFQLADWLGSRRVQTDISGNPEETFVSLPFGDGLAPAPAPGAPPTADDATEHHFTGKERDAESGNDYFGARYYASSMGRFLSPDDGSDQNNFSPQSWNLYSYVQNNPLTNTDADGRSVQICTNDSSGSQKCTTVDNPTYDKAASGNNGGLNVPSEKSVERTGSGNITDSSGNVVGTVKYVVDGGLDGPANLAGASMIGNGGMAAIKEFAVQSSIGALTEGIGQGIGIGIDALRVARAAKAAEAAEALAVAERVTQHAYLKHAGEFGNISRNEFQELVQETIANPSEVRSLSNGRTAYWSDSQQMVVIENGTAPTQSTAFRPSGGKSYFDNMH